MKPLLGFYQHGRTGADFDTGIQTAIQAMLVSPDFLFRAEQDPATTNGQRFRGEQRCLGHHWLAALNAAATARTLWSTVPT